MKTLEELYKEIMASDELKAKFAEAAKEKRELDFLKEQGSEATAEELKAFLDEKMKEDSQLSLDELDNAAGGGCNAETSNEVIGSVFSVGVGCAVIAAVSAATGHVGQENEDEGRLCTEE